MLYDLMFVILRPTCNSVYSRLGLADVRLASIIINST